MAVLLDFHHVIETVRTAEEASNFLSIVDKLRAEDVKFVGCSHGAGYMEVIFAGTEAYREIVSAMDGWIFTKEKWWDRRFDVSRIRRTKQYPHCRHKIVVNADKGFVSKVLGIPTMLFDDKIENAQAHDKEHPWNRSIIVKRGRKWWHQEYPPYIHDADISSWFWRIMDWEEDICRAAGIPLVVRHDRDRGDQLRAELWKRRYSRLTPL